MEIIVREGQNIFDLAIQYFGDSSFAATLIKDNNLTQSAALTAGQKLYINTTVSGNQEVKDFFELSEAVVQNKSN